MHIFGSKQNYIEWIPFIVVCLIIILAVIAITIFVFIYFYNKLKEEYCKYQNTLQTVEKLAQISMPIQCATESTVKNLSLLSSSTITSAAQIGSSIVQNNMCHINTIATGLLKRLANLMEC